MGKNRPTGGKNVEKHLDLPMSTSTSTSMCPCPCLCPSAHVHVQVHVSLSVSGPMGHGQGQGHMDVDVDLGRFLQLNFREFIILLYFIYISFFPIFYSTFCTIQHLFIRRFVPFAIFPFNILSRSVFFPFNVFSIRRFLLFNLLSQSAFFPFDVLYHSAFFPFDVLSHSAFCLSTLCCSTFCTFGVCYFDLLSVNRKSCSFPFHLNSCIQSLKFHVPISQEVLHIFHSYKTAAFHP